MNSNPRTSFFLACLFAFVMIFSSAIIGAKRENAAMLKKLEVYFEKGDGLSIQIDLNKRIELSNNLLTVAKRYIDGNKVAAEMEQAIKNLQNAETISEKHKNNLALTAAYTKLYEALETVSLSEKDAEYRRGIFVDLEGRNHTIQNDIYNQLVAETNHRMEQFPMVIFNRMGLLEHPVSFGK